MVWAIIENFRVSLRNRGWRGLFEYMYTVRCLRPYDSRVMQFCLSFLLLLPRHVLI